MLNLTRMIKRKRILAFGRVQGVLFRYNISKVANSLELKGFVRNLDDGSVEVLAEGEEDKLNKLIDFCRKGLMFARVERIEVNEEKVKDEFERFEIRY